MEHDGKQQHIPALCIFSLFDHVHIGGGIIYSQLSDVRHVTLSCHLDLDCNLCTPLSYTHILYLN